MKSKFTKNPFYEMVLAEMNEAAGQAAEGWVKKHTQPAYVVKDGFTNEIVGSMLDVCGGAYLEISDGRKTFARYYKKRCEHEMGYKCQTRSIRVHHKYSGRQEMGLNEAAVEGAYQVLKKYSLSEGIYFRSYID